MNFLKNNIRIIIGLIIGVLIASGITVYAYSYIASDISYTKPGTETAISVEEALNDLYSKSNKTSQQVTTLTTQGESYTFQNDGYITGTASTPDGWNANLLFDGEPIAVCPGDTTRTFQVSVYVTKGTVVQTRSDHGAYNLTCYEFK